MTDIIHDTWEDENLAKLYEAILSRMIYTYMLNELVKTGIKTPMKDGILERLRREQKTCNLTILTLVRRIDRGTRD